MSVPGQPSSTTAGAAGSPARGDHAASGLGSTGPGGVNVTTGVISGALGARLVGPSDLTISSVGSLDEARPGALTFIRSGKFASRWAGSKASAALVTEGIDVPGHDASKRALIFVPQADLAIIELLKRFQPKGPAPTPGVHPTAVVDPSAHVDPTASVGAFCVIGASARVGPRSVLASHVVLGFEAGVGADCHIHPRVAILDRCSVGDRCLLWPGVTLGADGFGFQPHPTGQGFIKVPHAGFVRVGNDVEIGSNSCIDRGKFGPTLIGDGTKIDNLVQIAHNCVIGRSVLICGACAIAGSVTIGDGAVLGGGVGVRDGLNIGAGARLAGFTGLMRDMPAGETWQGYPAQPAFSWMREITSLHQLPAAIRALRKAGLLDGPDRKSTPGE